jgi:hypothetical protein
MEREGFLKFPRMAFPHLRASDECITPLAGSMIPPEVIEYQIMVAVSVFARGLVVV